jgi:Xaa-Pro aminopeptidase
MVGFVILQCMSRTKNQSDIDAIKQSVKATESAVLAVIEYLKQTENPNSEDAKDVLDRVLGELNYESPEDRIVAGGIKTFEPHYMGTGLIERNQPIVIDIYPRSKETGFYADMTRTVCLGEPSKELQAMYNAVLQAHTVSVATLRSGARCCDVHRAAVNVFESLGYTTTGAGTLFTHAEGFVHSVGHGLGKNVHEEPRVGMISEDVLQTGDVITIEPGLYYKHIGGVRLEDLFVITNDGYEQLTSLPLELGI